MTSKEFLATFTQAWNDHDVDKLMEHMDSDCAFYASVGFEVEGTKCEGWDDEVAEEYVCFQQRRVHIV